MEKLSTQYPRFNTLSAGDFDEVMTTSTALDGVNSVISSNIMIDFPKEVRVASDDTQHVTHITFTDGPCKLQLQTPVPLSLLKSRVSIGDFYSLLDMEITKAVKTVMDAFML